MPSACVCLGVWHKHPTLASWRCFPRLSVPDAAWAATPIPTVKSQTKNQIPSLKWNRVSSQARELMLILTSMILKIE